jgi:hypothetical protein
MLVRNSTSWHYQECARWLSADCVSAEHSRSPPCMNTSSSSCPPSSSSSDIQGCRGHQRINASGVLVHETALLGTTKTARDGCQRIACLRGAHALLGQVWPVVNWRDFLMKGRGRGRVLLLGLTGRLHIYTRERLRNDPLNRSYKARDSHVGRDGHSRPVYSFSVILLGVTK